ncbi:MAG: carbamoyltransferase HypF [Solirubrobacteraceae bacterium]
MSVRPAARRRAAIRVTGVVQGVGFRPFVLRRARELGLDGFVRNDTRGVLVEAEGAPEAVERLIADLPALAPPLAQVERVDVAELAPGGAPGFAIAGSDAVGEPRALVSADGATCADCLAELRDPTDRRFRYPFINCTNCGPRFTIVRGVPYDRPQTTMAGFEMCARCRAEYEDPADRRFHAQPNACPACGPRARLVGADGGGDAVAAAAELLCAGAIVAVKGLGGYHLACRAADERAVATLRARKHREDKPFALMAPDVRAARALVALGPEDEALLTSVARPIVLAPRWADAAVAAAVAPASRELGVMLPYTPLHHLLLCDAGGTLVMTSGNRSDEPIAYRDADAQACLAGIADALLVHDRPIHMRTDDSVMRVVAGRRTVLRRARGLVPERLALPVPAPEPLLACGAHLKSTVCVAKGDGAWVSHHIGDLDDAATRLSFAEAATHFEALFAVTPRVVAHDAHPDYASTAYALERTGVRHVAVQHHHAHLAAVLAEHGETGPAVGAIYDGSGLGSDGTVWGGELLAGDLRGFVRAGHVHPVALPGGDRAARQPWRMAAAWLVAAGARDPQPGPRLRGLVRPQDWATVCEMARRGFSSPQTTSMGRLFDAVAALCGVRASCTYEGQAAIELEGLADPAHGGAYELPLTPGGVLDARPLIRAVAADVGEGTAVAMISARLHHGVARATARACAQAAEAHGTQTVVLAGGVFQNRLLLEETAAALQHAGLRVLVPRRLPANDGAISFGQAAIVAAGGAGGAE